MKNFEGFTADRSENIRFNEVQEDVEVLVFSYTILEKGEYYSSRKDERTP